tara:strand:+ start:237 stop:887 length:651 start_codon:yes stop_codon:yes gene_type:complete
MKTSFLFFTISFLCFIISCATNKEFAKKSIFSFSANGLQYQIICINTESGEGTNYLAHINDQGYQLSLARDLDQDGSIDQILHNEFTLSDANKVYKIGIEKARLMGSYNERSSLRTFEYIDGQTTYTIKTYIIDKEIANNLFLISNSILNTESMFIDTNANGELDSREKGVLQISEANILYKSLLKNGVNSGEIEFKNRNFWVKEVNILNSATALK